MRSLTTFVWVVLGGGWLLGCGSQAGTESGNPINPPNPPGEHSVGPPVGIDEDPPVGPAFVPGIPDDGSLFEPDPVDEPEPIEEPNVPEAPPPEPTMVAEPDLPPASVPSGGTPQTDGAPTPEPTEVPTNSMEDMPSPDLETPAAAPSSDPATAPGDGAAEPVPNPPPCEPAQCQADAQATAQSLAAPMPSGVAFDSADCQVTASGSICSCRGPDGIVTMSTDSSIECVVMGRFGCLYEGAEFLGCDPAGTECAAVCDEITTRQADDDGRSASVEVRAAVCLDDGTCGYVLSSEQECWIGGPTLSSVDCTLTDEEILGLPPGATE